MEKINWFNEFMHRLNEYPEGKIWSNGDDILCDSEKTAGVISNIINQLYSSQGEDITIITGYYDPSEDKRYGMADEYSGWWYVTID